MNVIKRIIIPIDKHIDRITAAVRKGSNTDLLCITLTEQGRVYKLDNAVIAAIKGLKPDGTEFYNACVINNNEIHYSVTGQSVNITGSVMCELVLFNETGDKIISADFELRVFDELFGDNVVESTVEFTVIEAILASVASTKAAVDETAAHVDAVYASLPDAAYYKGTIGADGSGADFTTLPTSYKKGHTYKIISDGTYAGETCEAGDFIYATVNRAGSGNENSDWSVIQKNIVGAITNLNASTGITITGSGSSRTISLCASGVTAGSYGDGSDQSPGFGDTFTIYQITVDDTGRITGVSVHALEIPSNTATSSADGLMSKEDKDKLDGIDAGANKLPDVTSSDNFKTMAVEGGEWTKSDSKNNILIVEITSTGSGYSSSHTLSQIQTAQAAGRTVVCKFENILCAYWVTNPSAVDALCTNMGNVDIVYHDSKITAVLIAFSSGDVYVEKRTGYFIKKDPTDYLQSGPQVFKAVAGTQESALPAWVPEPEVEYSIHSDTDSQSGLPFIQLLNEKTISPSGNIYFKGEGSAETSRPSGDYTKIIIKTPEGMTDVLCDTSGSTAAKVGQCRGFILVDGGRFTILIKYANTATSGVTLNIENTGAMAVYLNGSAISASNYDIPAGTYDVFYDGTTQVYHIRTDDKLTADITGDAATVNNHSVEKDVPSNALFTDHQVAYGLDESSDSEFPIIMGNASTPNTGSVKYGSGLRFRPSTSTLAIRKYEEGSIDLYPGKLNVNGTDYRAVSLDAKSANQATGSIKHTDTSDLDYNLILPAKNGTLATDDLATTSAPGLMSAADKQAIADLQDATALNGIIAGLENNQGTLGIGGRITQLPTRYDIGWFWRVITAGTYANIECQVNDILVAMVERHDSGNLDADWSRIRPVNGNITISSWADFPTIIRAGIHEHICECGDVVTLRYNNTDVPCQIIGINIGTNATNAKLKNSIRFQPINNLVDKEFDAREAFYSQDTVLPAGTYHFKVGAYTWKTDEQNKYYQFTLTEDVPADGQLIFSQEYNATFANAYVRVYAKGSPDKLDEATMTEGTGGTDLGTLNNTLQTNINSSQRTVLGNNRYSQSNIRVWLNAAPDAEPGTIWEPQNKWDRCLGWLRTDASFQSLVDPNLLAVVGTSKLTVAKNTLCDGGGSETVNDKFFLLSRDEVYGGKEVSSVTEGLTCQFYSKYSALSAAGAGADANRKKKTGASFKYWWLRTPFSGYSSHARYVYPDGSVHSSYAKTSNGLAPAWDIY